MRTHCFLCFLADMEQLLPKRFPSCFLPLLLCGCAVWASSQRGLFVSGSWCLLALGLTLYKAKKTSAQLMSKPLKRLRMLRLLVFPAPLSSVHTAQGLFASECRMWNVFGVRVLTTRQLLCPLSLAVLEPSMLVGEDLASNLALIALAHEIFYGIFQRKLHLKWQRQTFFLKATRQETQTPHWDASLGTLCSLTQNSHSSSRWHIQKREWSSCVCMSVCEAFLCHVHQNCITCSGQWAWKCDTFWSQFFAISRQQQNPKLGMENI